MRRLLPYGLRVRLRALVDARRLEPRDVEQVKATTAAQWRNIGARAPHHLETYWAGADDPASYAVAKRRSEWLAGLAPFRDARSVIELGCNVGRNLFVLTARHPGLVATGVDIDPEAIAFARKRVGAELLVGDLYDVNAVLGDRGADVIFTMGVLIHLHPDAIPPVLAAMARRVRSAVVLVEQVSDGDTVVKGPASWHPERRVTGDYIQWSPNLPRMLEALGLPFTIADVPGDLQTNGARHLLVVRPGAGGRR